MKEVAQKHKIAFKSNKDPNYTTVFKRSGKSYSKRLQTLVVRNNAVQTISIKADRSKSASRKGPPRSKSFLRSTYVRSATPLVTEVKKMDKVRFNITPNPERQISTGQCQRLYKKTYQSNQGKMSTLNHMMSPVATMRIIRKILHPFLPEDRQLNFAETVIC